MAEMMQLSASLEDYLEAIYHTVEAKGAARAKDIVMRLGVHNSSVTQALKSLAEKELVNYAPYDTITLTASGEAIAKDVVKRHVVLRKFLGTVLGLPPKEADEGACRMEHSVSAPILDRIVAFVEYFENCPANDIRWEPSAGYFCGKKHDHEGTCGRDSCGHDLELHLPDLKKPAAREGG
ncbi:MAG: metal-dependent transcriptional regulator [Krumholzibacteria bacterium]|nr:metal-dependent transcriptional regulator [Candidatus Krumholzibacteria bacterium]